MPLGGVILVEPSLPGNIGAAMRIAANFGVRRFDVVRPAASLENAEVRRWACGADQWLECRDWEHLTAAAADYRTLAATASGRGRQKLTMLTPIEAVPILVARGLEEVALVFGNETRGLSREDIDRCDVVIRISTNPEFPVLNLAQAVAIIVATLSAADTTGVHNSPEPAPQEAVDGLMRHLEASLLTIGFLDPQSPQRILRQLRRLFGRAGITANEVKLLRGICRQMEWAAGAKPARFPDAEQNDP
jgi:TrmH family RNA methyltransferase